MGVCSPRHRRGRGERIVIAPIDISALRQERQTRSGHHMLAHLRTEAYDVYRRPGYPPSGGDPAALSYSGNRRRIEAAKRAFVSPPSPARLTRS